MFLDPGMAETQQRVDWRLASKTEPSEPGQEYRSQEEKITRKFFNLQLIIWFGLSFV